MTTIVKKNGNSTFKKTVLSNGLRVISENIPSVRSITVGVWFDVGSRHETEQQNGISHLIEHMLFKGTKNRNSKEIAASLESIGGNLNAFTSKEQTCYIARILDDHLPTAIDVLADLTTRSTLTPNNLKKEKKVILEEISESLENPSDYIHDIFSSTYWPEHPLGRPILGTVETVNSFTPAQLKKFIKNNYRSESTIIAASGSIKHNKLVRLVQENFDFAPGKSTTPQQADIPQGQRISIVENDNNQIHICLGYPGLNYSDSKKIALLTLHSYLGGGMSSQLFQRIREDKGLAYTIYTYVDLYRDSGLFGAYLATDKRNFAQAMELTIKELNTVKRRKISKDRFDKVKAQLKGQMTLGMESTSSRMNRIARNEIMLSSYTPLSKTLRQIDAVTPDDLHELVNRVFDHNNLAVAVLGPADKNLLKNII